MNASLRRLIAQAVLILFAVGVGVIISMIPKMTQLPVVVGIGALTFLVAVATVTTVFTELLGKKEEAKRRTRQALMWMAIIGVVSAAVSILIPWSSDGVMLAMVIASGLFAAICCFIATKIHKEDFE